MTPSDPTTVLPVVDVADLPGSTLRGATYDEEGVDELLAELAVPVADRLSLGDRAALFIRELTSTPRRAAAATAWVFAAVALAVVCLDQPTVSARTSLGSAKASCGIDVFIYGYSDPVIARACRHAEATHLGLFSLALIVVLAGLTAAIVVALRYSDGTGSAIRHAFAGAPVQAVLVALGAIAVLLGAFALRPAPIQLVRSGVLLTAHCGAAAYFFGYPDPKIQTACRHAYAGQGHIVVAAIIVVAIGLAAQAQVVYTRAADRWARQRLARGVCAGILAVIAVVASLPVSVNVNEGPAPVVAACGLDTFVAGYPDHTVQTACRAHFASHAAVGLSAGTLAIVILGWGAVTRRRLGRTAVHTDPEASHDSRV
jgi:uncharacterized membrane protein YidH (DUF202 family)